MQKDLIRHTCLMWRLPVSEEERGEIRREHGINEVRCYFS